jgi:hypothetical protein
MTKLTNIYPNYNDESFQVNIYKKREYYIHKVPIKKKLESYQDIKNLRDQTCNSQITSPLPHQLLLSNFINPETPFRGLLVFHGVGSGKCIHPKTELYINNLLISIEDLWYKYHSSIIYDIEGNQWSKPIIELNITSLNSNKFITNKIKYIYREYYIGYLRKIIFSNGSSITCTYSHKIYVNNNFTNNIELDMNVGFNINGKLVYHNIIDIIPCFYNGYIYDLEIDCIHNYIANNIIVHNTCGAYTIAENFKDMVKKYNTKIHILVSGPLLREQWKNELITVCARDVYLKEYSRIFNYLNENEKNKIMRIARETVAQYYKIMSYRSFQKKVLGQKIIEKSVNSKKKIFKKTEEGEYERDLTIDKIESLNNTLLIVDEAHILTGNEYGLSIKKIINNSKNLRILLLTATPMKNLADDIIELINFLRPNNDQIVRDNVFNNSGHLLSFTDGGNSYLRKMVNGYVSYFRGSDPYLYAEGIEQGDIPEQLIYTKLTRCNMNKFQLDTYNKVIELVDDTLDRRSQAVANFVFPGIDYDDKKLNGYYGEEGMYSVINMLKIEETKKILITKINEEIYNNKYKDPIDLLNYDSKKKIITGKILHRDHLANYSIKFHTALLNLERLIESDKGCGTAFIYSNLVKVGINLFQEILLENGYLEFNETRDYIIKDDTIDYRTGLQYSEYKKLYDINTFYPATFLTITGQTEDMYDDAAEKKIYIKNKYFNNINNRDGKLIKFILGSKVMNEGITLKNVKEIHILDVYWNLGKIHQVIGRAIRWCVHYDVMTEENPYPVVDIYKYVISLKNGNLTTEEDLYKKAELKYIMIKNVERILKECSIDCPLNYNGNIIAEEVEKYKNCVKPLESDGSKIKCPVECDFQNCRYVCYDNKLNLDYYDKNTNIYKSLDKKKLDYSTFTNILKKNEINQIKEKIKVLYKYKYVYELDEIIEAIYNSITKEQKELFDNFFIYKALDELIPLDENDFNNFTDVIYDKYSKAGYLIYVKKYYIFQPFDQNENVPMWYRSNYITELKNNISLYDYLKSDKKFINILSSKTYSQYIEKYDFESVLPYYNNKIEYIYVGILDRASNNIDEVFKLRPKLHKTGDKKRGIGIFSIKGAVCETSKDKNYLIEIAKKIGIENIDKYKTTRMSLCKLIKFRLLYLEKYTVDDDKLTYMIIPKNHSKYNFPINLQDRINYIISEFNTLNNGEIKYKIKTYENGIFEGKRNKSLIKYKLDILTNNPKFDQLFTKYNFTNSSVIIE